MTPQQFIAKWQRVTLSERAACQQHYLDLCELLGQPKPAEADPDGTWYTFEKGVETTEDKRGWADVWMRDHFGWEYKGRHKDLKAAYAQLLLYREALENPPLLVVCDMDRFEVHTNFTGTAKRVHAFDLAGLADGANLDILRRVFTDPASLRPGITSEAMTVEAAERFAKLADGLRQKGIEPLRAAHFLMKLMFCMFGEDIGLLPPGLFGKLLDTGKANSAMLPKLLKTLFEAMSSGGVYGSDMILWFNGGLFNDSEVLPLTTPEINTLANINQYDWAAVEPSIFGTLFERTLDPAKRSQIGAHYTSRADIETLLKPVLLAPLQREWAEVKRKCEEELWPKVVSKSRVGQAQRRPTKSAAKETPARRAFDRALLDFMERLAHVRVLDPACGSGNFLYVAIHSLLDLEKEVVTYASGRGLSLMHAGEPRATLRAGDQSLRAAACPGGDLDRLFAVDALQRLQDARSSRADADRDDPADGRDSGFDRPGASEGAGVAGGGVYRGEPAVLGWIRNACRDSGTAMSTSFSRFTKVGFRTNLTCAVTGLKSSRLRRGKEVQTCRFVGDTRRAGRFKSTGARTNSKDSAWIFFAESDRDWVLDGASVHVSMVGFEADDSGLHVLDGESVKTINANLSATADITKAKVLFRECGTVVTAAYRTHGAVRNRRGFRN